MKKIVKRNKKKMVSQIAILSKKISRHSEIVKETIKRRKEIFHESIYAEKFQIMNKLKYETQRKQLCTTI